MVISKDMKEAIFFSDFVEAITVVEGRKGTGKTLFAVALAWKLREIFNRQVILDFKAKKAFGAYTFLDEGKFIGEMEKFTKLARSTPQEEVDTAAEWSLRKQGIDLTEKTIVLDEAYRYFEARRPSDKFILAFGYFIAQSRHYKNSIILLAPRKRYIDYRVRDQVDISVKVAFNEYTGVVFARCLDQRTGEVRRLKVYGPNYWDMYDSWSPVALRKKVLDMRHSL